MRLKDLRACTQLSEADKVLVEVNIGSFVVWRMGSMPSPGWLHLSGSQTNPSSPTDSPRGQTPVCLPYFTVDTQ